MGRPPVPDTPLSQNAASRPATAPPRPRPPGESTLPNNRIIVQRARSVDPSPRLQWSRGSRTRSDRADLKSEPWPGKAGGCWHEGLALGLAGPSSRAGHSPEARSRPDCIPIGLSGKQSDDAVLYPNPLPGRWRSAAASRAQEAQGEIEGAGGGGWRLPEGEQDIGLIIDSRKAARNHARFGGTADAASALYNSGPELSTPTGPAGRRGGAGRPAVIGHSYEERRRRGNNPSPRSPAEPH